MSQSQIGLFIPVDLSAYCVGVIDAQECTPDFAGCSTLFTNIMGDNNAQVSANVLRDFNQSPLWPLEKGVHLHWAMPDALTKGRQTNGELAYPPLPNRWLLTRVTINGSQLATKIWIITSDILSVDQTGNNVGATLPVTASNDNDQNFRYLGVTEIFTNSWQEPVIPPGQSIKALTENEINTVASGDIAFAAFYPNGRNIFGFYDDVADLSESTTSNLMYVLTGWFSDPSNDPLATPLTLDQLQKSYKWTCQDYDDKNMATYSLYHGIAQDIEWNANTRYIKDNSTPYNAEIAIGNNPAEALAAYFKNKNNESTPLFEELLTAFEIGALSKLIQPNPNQIIELKEILHEKQFASFDGGIIYSIENAKVSNDNEYYVLPVQLADALNLLNQYEQEYDLAKLELNQYQWRLFAEWYRIIEVDPSMSSAAYNSLQSSINQKDSMLNNVQTAKQNRDTAKSSLQAMLSDQLSLEELAGPKFYQPNEPVVLIAHDTLQAAKRYGGDGRFNADGYLVCRLNNQCVSQVTVGTQNPKVFNANQYSQVLLPQGNHLIYSDDIDLILQESVLFNTDFLSAATAIAEVTLKQDLETLLAGNTSANNNFTNIQGFLPSPVGIQWLTDGNPEFPMFAMWETDFHPLLATNQNNSLQNYPNDILKANFSISPDNPGYLSYAPSSSLAIDPSTIDFNPLDPNSGTQSVKGVSLMSSKAADSLESLLIKYLKVNPDKTLQNILTELQNTNIFIQSLSGFNAALLMMHANLQMTIAVSSSANLEVRMLTKHVQDIITDISNIRPEIPSFNGNYNPFRAGFLKLSLKIVDAFGQKRDVSMQNNLYIANSMTTIYQNIIDPNIVYLQPRISEASRLLFRWLSSDAMEYEEMNSHPAMSPICGWLLTDHLSKGIFIYAQNGRSLGSLTPSTDEGLIIWQPAPGDDDLINETVSQVMENQNPHLAIIVNKLAALKPTEFIDFWNSIDTAASMTTPTMPNSGTGIGLFIGRPLAVVQASMLLELQGISDINLGWETYSQGSNQFIETDNGLSKIQIPAIVGDIQQIDDGLIGYFMQNDTQYDLSTFYCESAYGSSWIQKPNTTTITLTPQSTTLGTAPSVKDGERKLLLLMDPQAGIHLTSGILPTQYIEIPPEHYVDTMNSLEMAFLTAPVLQPGDGSMLLPLAKENGFSWSWVEEDRTGNSYIWQTIPDIRTPVANAIWTYSPQKITEGWLRLNPEVLQFSLVNASGRPYVSPGVANTLTFNIVNQLHSAVTCNPSTIVHEGDKPSGTMIYVHFGKMVKPEDIGKIILNANDWAWQIVTDSFYGTYLAISPQTNDITLEPKTPISLTISNILVDAKLTNTVKVYFDYYQVTGIPDNGVDTVSLVVS